MASASFPLKGAGFRKLNHLMSSLLGAEHLLSVCTCLEKTWFPGPHHTQACPCYATSRVKLMKCKGVKKEKVGRRTVLSGPIEFHFEEMHGPGGGL